MLLKTSSKYIWIDKNKKIFIQTIYFQVRKEKTNSIALSSPVLSLSFKVYKIALLRKFDKINKLIHINLTKCAIKNLKTYKRDMTNLNIYFKSKKAVSLYHKK